MEEANIKRSEFIENNLALLDMPGTNRPNRRRSSSLSQLSRQNPTNRRNEINEINQPKTDYFEENPEQNDQDLINDTAVFDEFFKDLKKSR